MSVGTNTDNTMTTGFDVACTGLNIAVSTPLLSGALATGWAVSPNVVDRIDRGLFNGAIRFENWMRNTCAYHPMGPHFFGFQDAAQMFKFCARIRTIATFTLTSDFLDDHPLKSLNKNQRSEFNAFCNMITPARVKFTTGFSLYAMGLLGGTAYLSGKRASNTSFPEVASVGMFIGALAGSEVGTALFNSKEKSLSEIVLRSSKVASATALAITGGILAVGAGVQLAKPVITAGFHSSASALSQLPSVVRSLAEKTTTTTPESKGTNS